MIPSASLGRFASRVAARPGRPDRRAAEPDRRSRRVGDRDELRRRHGFEGPDARVRRPAARSRSRSTSWSRRSRPARASRSWSPATGRSVRGWTPSSASSGSATACAFSGAQPRETVLELLAAADAEVLSSGWENFPHSRDRGARGRDAGDRDRRRRGRARSSRTARTGCSSRPATRCARGRDPPLLRRRGRCASGCGRPLAGSVAALRAGARVRPAGGAAPGGGRVSARSRGCCWSAGRATALPLEREPAARSSTSLARAARPARAGERRRRRGATRRDASSSRRRTGRARSTGRCYFLGLPLRIAPRAAPFAARRRPRPGCARDLVRPARALAVGRAHAGDPRRPRRLAPLDAAVRLAGPRLLTPIADRVAVSALRRADAVRTISDYTTGLVRVARRRAGRGLPGVHGPRAVPRRRRAPLPDGAARALRRRARALQGRSTGSPRRGGSSLAQACRRRRSHLVGTRHAARGRRAAASRTCRSDEWTRARCRPRAWRARSTTATVLVLPSRSEGLGRVLVEAFCRGRRRRRDAGRRHPRPRPATARTGCSSRRGTRGARGRARAVLLADRALAERLGARRDGRRGRWRPRRRSSRHGCAALVVAGLRLSARARRPAQAAR